MKVIAINGSPRKNWNTADLLEHALKGAESRGAETELFHLYDLDYKGCISCFACKRVGFQDGICTMKDDLKNVLEKIEEADVLIFGSPIYFGDVTGEMRSFLERLFFQYLVYDENYSVNCQKKTATAFIYTMNVNEQQMKMLGYDSSIFNNMEMQLQRFFGYTESLCSFDTYQFDDYSKYVSSAFDLEEKARKREEEFSKDRAKAFEMGVRFAEKALE
ncbi:flavodoxin family protein [Methanolobus profundi]|uniref:Multimeric flavodoxin WrbA n=1 Tax=Methanolobus profundi TaxID=487685 RepID=A0A1I4S388_9EURY|nr:flavodoxin family protein [Methanolobus profundi]SFM58986.1 Multimeric flavodoxin WrbA [Methanolobus profundi]